jgi:hypothetical protein
MERRKISTQEETVMNIIDEQAKAAVREIVFDLTDRYGLRNEWAAIDEVVQQEIIAKWQEIITRAMHVVKVFIV